MRGKVVHGSMLRTTSRITPAYAGKSRAIPDILRKTLDHPRLCGEKSRNISQVPTMQGSPPPMRGKDFDSGFVKI